MHPSHRHSRRHRRARILPLLLLVAALPASFGLLATAGAAPATRAAATIYLPLLSLPKEVGTAPSPTATGTRTATATGSPTRTSTATRTATRTATSTATRTSTATSTSTSTSTSTATRTATSTATSTSTATATRTATATTTSTAGPAMQVVWRQMADYPRTFVNAQNEVKKTGNSEGLSIVLNNKLYVFGGYNRSGDYRPTARAYIFDPSVGTKGTWTEIASMPKGNTHAGIATDGRYIYIVSGYIANSSGGQTFGTTEVYRYDPQVNSYSLMRRLPQEQAAGVAAVIGNQLHYVGGTNPARNAELANHWTLDLSNPSATWQARAPLPNPRTHMGVAVYGGKLYVIGGQRRHDDDLLPQTDVHVYDPATNSWSEAADLPEGRNHVSSTTFLLNGEIYVLGGQHNHEVPRNTVLVYSPTTNSWRSMAQANPWQPRHSAVGGAINGKIYFLTGSFAWIGFEGSFQAIP